jgi:hypothetical protein
MNERRRSSAKGDAMMAVKSRGCRLRRSFSRGSSCLPWRHIREQRAQSFRHRRVRENGLGKPRI